MKTFVKDKKTNENGPENKKNQFCEVKDMPKQFYAQWGI